jgi:hypothetical protein
MSLQQLVLDEAIIASLYRNISFLPNAEKSEETTQNGSASPVLPTKTLKFLGGNRKAIAVLVKHDDDVFLPDVQLTFLVAILQACKLTLEDVAIVNYSSAPFTYDSLTKTTAFKQLLIFGIEPTAILLPEMAYFSPITYNEIRILYAPELEKLNTPSENGRLLKSKLWLCLKQFFI